MGKWFPRLYDTFMTPLEKKGQFKKIRQNLIAKAEGEVLEIGSGTGINFPLYRKASHVIAIEPNSEMIKKSLPKINQAGVSIEIKKAKAEWLPYADHTFDTVVATLVFCTIPNPAKALEEISRVLKVGGTLLLFEHVKMDNQLLSRLQTVLTPAWRRVCDGCHLDRDTLELIRQSTFHIDEINVYYQGLFKVIKASNSEAKSKK